MVLDIVAPGQVKRWFVFDYFPKKQADGIGVVSSHGNLCCPTVGQL